MPAAQRWQAARRLPRSLPTLSPSDDIGVAYTSSDSQNVTGAREATPVSQSFLAIECTLFSLSFGTLIFHVCGVATSKRRDRLNFGVHEGALTGAAWACPFRRSECRLGVAYGHSGIALSRC